MKVIKFYFIALFVLFNGFKSLAQMKFDFSGMAEFWKIYNILAKDNTPTESEWNSLLKNDAYRLLKKNSFIKQSYTWAYKPSAKQAKDSAIRSNSIWQMFTQHLADVPEHKERIGSLLVLTGTSEFRKSIIKKMSSFLPNNSTKQYIPPPVCFAIFQPDGFAIGDSVILDAYFASSLSLVQLQEFIAHEIHHFYANKLLKLKKYVDDIYEGLIHSLKQLQLEGVADLIDKKKYPIQLEKTRNEYENKYNFIYSKADSILSQFDSLICLIGTDTTIIKQQCTEIYQSLPLGGHPVGLYMATAINKVRGKKKLIATLHSPFTFFKEYNLAATKSKGYYKFSKKAKQVIADVERRFAISNSYL